MAVDTGLEPAVRSSRIICFQDRLLTIRIIHHIFNLRIHFILLISGWAVTVIVIRPYRPTTYAYAFLTSNCHTRHGISVLHISLVDSDELYITFGFILLLPINFRHSFGCHTVSSPPDRPKSINESLRMYTPLIPQAVDVPFCLCVEDEQDKLLVQWSGLEPLSKAFQLNIPFLMSTSSARLSYHCIWLGRRDLNSLWRSQSPMCCQLHYVPISCY